MSTVNKELAQKIIDVNGYYMDDPRVYAVLTYTNGWDAEAWAIVYTKRDLTRYKPSFYVRIPKIVWSAKPDETPLGNYL